MTVAWTAIRNINALYDLNALNEITIAAACVQLEQNRSQPMPHFDMDDSNITPLPNPWYRKNNSNKKSHTRDPNTPDI